MYGAKMKAVVVGASGFLGSHVADKLSDSGYDVTLYDLFASKWQRDDQTMCVGNIQDFELLLKVTEGATVVYNFAALADINIAKSKPIETVNLNILGNVNVLEACHINNVSRFVFASSVYVYSREGGFYRCSKQAAEDYVREYQSRYGMDYTILRFGSLYGPRADDGNGLLRIVRSALSTGRVTYEGNIEATREYIHIRDAAQASVVALQDEYKNESLTLTGTESIKVNDLLKMLAEILNFSQEDVYFVDNHYPGHYVRTPYSYQSKAGIKLTLPNYVELGQGLLQIIENEDNSN